jgi:uncharacterized protein YbjT (DUF2867 family)
LRILVTGASGFIASAVIERLLADGHEVVACARGNTLRPRSPRLLFHQLDLHDYQDAAAWLPLLDGVDAVINAAGILKERSRGDFQAIHYRAPLALAQACARCGVAPFVQVSAMGAPEDGEFIRSKHRLDEALQAMPLATWILRPGLVLSLRGSYGGTSLIRAAASLPGFMVLPGAGTQQLQPVLLEDLAAITVRLLKRQPSGDDVLEVAGPEVVQLRDFIEAIRGWLRWPPPRWRVRVPERVVTGGATLSERLTAGPLGLPLWRMLHRGHVAEPGAIERLGATCDYRPRAVMGALAETASFVQDRWHARLYLLAPLVWLALVTIWIGSGVAGFLAGPSSYQPVLDAMAVPNHAQPALVLALSLGNLALGGVLLCRVWLRWVLLLMLAAVVGYTLVFSLFLPVSWLEPTGAVLKNLAIMALLGVALVLEQPR